MLIPSLYATSPRARSLRPVRVPSDQNTRWRLPHHFSPLRDNEFLVSPHWPDIYPPITHCGWTIAATSRTCDNYHWKYRRNDFVSNVLAGNYFFLPRFAVWRPSVVGFLFSIESATEWGITDHQYYDKRIPSVRLSVKMLPTDCVPYTDRINPSVKLFNGVVWRLMKSTTQLMT